MKYLPLVLSLLALCVGCASPKSDPLAEAPLLNSPDELTFNTAQALLKEGHAKAALPKFMELSTKAEDPLLRRRAALGAAQSLRAENNLAGALGVLTPLPLAVRDTLDARRCALAGELHLRLKAYEPAVIALERALAYEGDPAGRWRPAAAFNLGKAALALGVPEAAQKAFEQAKAGFEAQGNLLAVDRCVAMLADLETLLKTFRKQTPTLQTPTTEEAPRG